MTDTIFIDGEAGTTGLEIATRLEGRDDLAFIRLGERERKEESARRAALNEADIAILCLPDDAAREAVSLIDPASGTRVIDASTAHRVADGWTYGFPELTAGQKQEISGALHVTNPGCYPTGMLGLVRPLVEAGLLPADHAVTVNAVSGYSGGGKAMIAEFEDASASNHTEMPFRLYALGLAHKHVPEMRVYGRLARDPLFSPSVGRYLKGMLVEVPLQLWALPDRPTLAALHEVLSTAYEGKRFVEVASLEESAPMKLLDPEGLNGTNRLRLFVFGNEKAGQARLVALLDNLGKGAAGQAVQCLNIMLGRDEALGLA